jgi:hypothetical protein
MKSLVSDHANRLTSIAKIFAYRRTLHSTINLFSFQDGFTKQQFRL